MFLLKYKGEIDGYLPLRNRSELIDLLSDFILQWSAHLPDQIPLQFDCQIVNDGSDTFARVRRVGDIQLNNRRIKGDLPRSPLELTVMIAKEEEHYSIDFIYEDIDVEAGPSLSLASKWTHDEDIPQVRPALKLRSVSKKKPKAAVARKPAPNRATSTVSSSLSAGALPSRTVKPEVCPLCGKSIERGGMLHKRDFHGEVMYSPSPRRTTLRCTWVAIYQGGAPGLGKGKS